MKTSAQRGTKGALSELYLVYRTDGPLPSIRSYLQKQRIIQGVQEKLQFTKSHVCGRAILSVQSLLWLAIFSTTNSNPVLARGEVPHILGKNTNKV